MKRNNKKYIKIRIFKLKFINKIKNKLDKQYKKSRLIIRSFKNNNKNVIFTQSLTI